MDSRDISMNHLKARLSQTYRSALKSYDSTPENSIYGKKKLVITGLYNSGSSVIEVLLAHPSDARGLAEQESHKVQELISIVHGYGPHDRLPSNLVEFISCVQQVMSFAAHAGVEYVVDADDFVMPDIEHHLEDLLGRSVVRFAMAAPAGTQLGIGAPVCFLSPVEPLAVGIEGTRQSTSPTLPRQVYRQADQSGGVTRDCVAPFHSELLPGHPVLRLLVADGARVTGLVPGVSSHSAPPVVFSDSEEGSIE